MVTSESGAASVRAEGFLAGPRTLARQASGGPEIDSPPGLRARGMGRLWNRLPTTANRQRFQYVVGVIALSIAYFLTAQVGLLFAIPPGNATAVWPPSGIALAVLLLAGHRFWPGVWLGAAMADLTTDISFAAVAVIATGNTMAAVLGAWLCRRFLDCQTLFGRVRDAFSWGVIAAVCCSLGATVGAGILVLAGHAAPGEFANNWWTWWLGDVSACMVLAPFLVAVGRRRPVYPSRRRLQEFALLLVLLTAVTYCVFGGWPAHRLVGELSYVPLILLFWALLRFGIVEVTTTVLLLSVTAVSATALGTGPFALDITHQNPFNLHIFMNVYAITGLTMAGLVAKGRETDMKRALLSAAVESAGEVILISDAEGTIQYANPAFERLSGYTATEVPGDTSRTLKSNITDGWNYSQIWDTISKGKTWRGFLQNRKKHGTLYDVHQTITPVCDREGKITSYVSVARDVTEQNRAEAARQADLEMQLTINSLLEISQQSVSFTELLERSLDRLLSVPWLNLEAKGSVYLVDDDSRQLTMKAQCALPESLLTACRSISFGHCLCGRAASTQQLVFADCIDDRHETEYEGMAPHGHYCVPILSDACLYGVLNLYVKAGHQRQLKEEQALQAIAHVLATMIRRMKAEDALQQSEERFDLAIRGTDAGIWDWDLRTNRVFFSPRWKTMLGHEEDEITGHYTEWESRLHPDDRTRALATIAEYLKGETPTYELEHRLKHKDGSYVWILARGAAVRDSEGRPYRMVGSHTDVTARKRSEQQLREKEVQLLAAAKIQQYFVPKGSPKIPPFQFAGASHAAEFAGGDYFDYLSFADGSIAIVIADVMGHGIGPALLMAETRAYLRTLIRLHSDVGEIVTHLNQFVTADMNPGTFVTLFLGRLDVARRCLLYASAGHRSYLLGEQGNARSLDATAFPLGTDSNMVIRSAPAITLEPGDIVLLMTDGIAEACSADGHMFGIAGALEVVQSHRHEHAGKIVEALCDAARGFSRGHPQDDDITALILKLESGGPVLPASLHESSRGSPYLL